MLKISPTKLGVILSACSPKHKNLNTRNVEYRNYDAVFWSPDMFENIGSPYIKRHSHEIYYEYLVNPDLLNPVECFSKPKDTSDRIKHIKKGILDKSAHSIIGYLNEPGTYPYCHTAFWTYSQAIKDLSYIRKEDIVNMHIVRTDKSKNDASVRPRSIVEVVDGLHKVSGLLPEGVIPPDCVSYVPIHLSNPLYSKYGGVYNQFAEVCYFLAGSDGTLIWKTSYRDNSFKDKVNFEFKNPCQYVIITPQSDIYIVIRDSLLPYYRILEQDFDPPGVVFDTMLWSILYDMFVSDGSVFDFVPGLMLPQIESIISEALLMGIKADPADLEHEEDGSITDLVTSIARKVNLVTYPLVLDRLRG